MPRRRTCWRYLRAADLAGYKARKEDTDTIFDGALDAVGELVLYCSTAHRLAGAAAPYLLPDRGEPRQLDAARPGAMTRAWCMFEMVKALAKSTLRGPRARRSRRVYC